MNKNSSIANLAEALAAAQGAFPAIYKTKFVKIKTAKGEYSYHYAPLDEIVAATRPVLLQHGLAVSQGCRDGVLTTLLMHRSGEWIEANDPIAPALDAKAYGSELSFKRRYAYTAILGLVTEDDDDGERANADHAIRNAPAQPPADAPNSRDWRSARARTVPAPA